ncbi:acetyltransferase [Pelagimonas varians]|uniref:Maltose O-acetyltransferase n=1 Tax=Pelagimonas varians TaxID=696760 RepID=A0A238L5T6_9RHOB|nr:acetyltransferase [Pelagimonas varians]PYG25489.1 putative colanic acid biosynthesis acetyltransferase WcaF [Pelagimonas varians]SMX50348.1 Maltose O-acetyltransferase [Pelagimonas varians]
MNTPHIDIEANRAARKYSRKELLGRVLWSLASLLFRFSPRLAWGWRNMLLRLFKARIGRNVRIFPTVRIIIPWTLTIDDGATVGDHAILYALGPMKIGASATVSQGAHLCGGSHDFRDPAFPLWRAPLTVESEAWIAADAFVGPGVTIGRGAVLGARAVAMKNIPANAVAAGNPAHIVGTRSPSAPASNVKG